MDMDWVVDRGASLHTEKNVLRCVRVNKKRNKEAKCRLLDSVLKIGKVALQINHPPFGFDWT